jgi:hypothetical protein
MHRNMKQIGEKTQEAFRNTKYLQHYALNIDEMCELYQMCNDGNSFESIALAFHYGFALGTRANSRKRIQPL